ncbi:MAG: toll/interleukin-1 receptor domain-containing protein, partial [Myxococcales bacterium]|nr:toll/interleukin-1 receptor domain-containing protein [Myxococcales bacterium]
MGLRTFLSYAGENRADVAVFRKHLSAAEHGGQIKVWIDSEKIPTGSDFDQKLTEALKRTDLLIAVLSKAYFSSTWCTKELQTARDRGIPVIPVLLEPCAYEFSGLGHLSATPDKGKKAVLEHPKKDQDVIWAKKVVPDIMAAVPVLPAPAPSPTPPPPTAPE